MATKKRTEKLAVKKQDGPESFLQLAEFVNCCLLDYKIIKRLGFLVYEKLSDSTIHGAWIHPDTDLTYLKKLIKKQKKEKSTYSFWISLFHEALYYNPVDQPECKVVVRNVAQSCGDIIYDLKHSNLKGRVGIALETNVGLTNKKKKKSPSISTKKAARLAAQSVRQASLKS